MLASSNSLLKNMELSRPLRALDLYSGVGGWAIGLRLAGIDVVASYERWRVANETRNKNGGHHSDVSDIRCIPYDKLPTNIDLVVGSPPCTQLSFANRGGGGDVDDALKDIAAFLSIVDYLRPTYWVMENVPRSASIIEAELKEGGKLERFLHLDFRHLTIQMDNFGLPQRRKRCLIGNINFKLLASYGGKTPLTMGQVVSALSSLGTVHDPIYGLTVDSADMTDHDTSDFLDEEEVRINRSNKISHPVYNRMPFPDPLDRSSRTITSTCTRVSRESIVIEDSVGKYRRLSLRERACLQGFPITFQFYGQTFDQKLTMIGNALPPPLAYLIGSVVQNVPPEALPEISSRRNRIFVPAETPARTPCRRLKMRYPPTRRFRFAIPSLRLSSGVRFELANDFESLHGWGVRFVYGTSKSIKHLHLDQALGSSILSSPKLFDLPYLSDVLSELRTFIEEADISHMQGLWAHRGPGLTRPFMLLDELDLAGRSLIERLQPYEVATRAILIRSVRMMAGQSARGIRLPGHDRLERNSTLIMAGVLIGCTANAALAGQAHKPAQLPPGVPALTQSAVRTAAL